MGRKSLSARPEVPQKSRWAADLRRVAEWDTAYNRELDAAEEAWADEGEAACGVEDELWGDEGDKVFDKKWTQYTYLTGNGLLNAVIKQCQQQKMRNPQPSKVANPLPVRLERMEMVIEAAARQASTKSPLREKGKSKSQSQRADDLMAGRVATSDWPTFLDSKSKSNVLPKPAINFDHDHGNACPSWLTVPSFNKCQYRSEQEPSFFYWYSMNMPRMLEKRAWIKEWEAEEGAAAEKYRQSAQEGKLSLRGGGLDDPDSEYFAVRTVNQNSERIKNAMTPPSPTTSCSQHTTFGGPVRAPSPKPAPHALHAPYYSADSYQQSGDHDAAGQPETEYSQQYYDTDSDAYEGGRSYCDSDSDKGNYLGINFTNTNTDGCGDGDNGAHAQPELMSPTTPSYGHLYSPIDEPSFSQSKWCKSTEEQNRIRRNKCKANFHHHRMEKSPAAPQTLKDWMNLREQYIMARRLYVEKKIERKEEGIEARRHMHAMRVDSRDAPSDPVARLSEKLQAFVMYDGLSTTLNRISIWHKSLCQVQYLAEWPTYLQLKAEGDERVRARYARRLPAPRLQVLAKGFAHLAKGPDAIPTHGPVVPYKYRAVAETALFPHLDLLCRNEAAELGTEKPTEQIALHKAHEMTQDLLAEILGDGYGFRYE